MRGTRITPLAAYKAAEPPRVESGSGRRQHGSSVSDRSMSSSAGKHMTPSEALNLHREALRQLIRSYGFARPCVFRSVLTDQAVGDLAHQHRDQSCRDQYVDQRVGQLPKQDLQRTAARSTLDAIGPVRAQP